MSQNLVVMRQNTVVMREKFSCNRPGLTTMTHQLHEMNFIITNYDVTLAIRETSAVVISRTGCDKLELVIRETSTVE